MQSATLRSLRDTAFAIIDLSPLDLPITYEALAEHADLSPRQIARCIRIMRGCSYLTTEPDSRWTGPGRVYRYTLDVESANKQLGFIRHAA